MLFADNIARVIMFTSESVNKGNMTEYNNFNIHIVVFYAIDTNQMIHPDKIPVISIKCGYWFY